MPILKIPSPLRYAEGQSSITAPGEKVSEVLEFTMEQYPLLKKHLLSDDQQLRPFVNVFLGDENIKELQGIETPLKEDDILLIIPSIAGG